MKKISVWIFFISILISSTSFAFDGKRKGFVLGGGLGFSPISKTTIKDMSDGEIKDAGLAFNLLSGYAWDDKNMIVWYWNDARYREENLADELISFYQAIMGISYYHYFGSKGNSFFITGGIGYQLWGDADDDDRHNSAGGGYTVGGGFEFARHFQVYTCLNIGTTYSSKYDYRHIQMLITITAIAY